MRLTLTALFFFSGAAGLIYEIVWLRMFARTLGVTSYATATVLAAFMGGLALGGFVFGRWSDRKDCNHLKLYAVIEIIIGFIGILMPKALDLLLPIYKWIYDSTGGSQLALTAGQSALLFVCVLIPTTFMGGTLPVISVFLTRRLGKFAYNLSLLYAWNTIGAVSGVLAAAFIMLDFLGESATIQCAVAINLLVAAVAFLLARNVSDSDDTQEAEEPDAEHEEPPSADAVPERLILLAIFCSGFTALAYEVIWSRHLILYLATSIYSFSCMLAVFLTGIAVGSHVLYRRLDRTGRPIHILAKLQFCIALLSLLSLVLFPILGMQSQADLLVDRSNILWVIIMLFPLAFCFGMTFPVASQCLVRPGAVGTSLGKLYASNTAGNILGSLGAGFILLPFIGGAKAVLLLVAANMIIGIVLLRAIPDLKSNMRRLAQFACAIVAIGIIALMGRDPFTELIEKRLQARTQSDYQIYENIEGIEGTVTAFNLNPKDDGPMSHNNKGLWLNGIGMTVLGPETKLMAHLPMLLKPDSENMLVICFGMGATVRSANLYPQLQVITVELVEEMFQCFRHFHPDAEDVLKSERVEIKVGDGRNYLSMTDRKFDIINIDPPPPIYSAGTVNLYTHEFMELCKSRLTDDGLMCLWVPMGSAIETVSICKTFLSVFPNTHLWSGPEFWGMYLIGFPEGVTYTHAAVDRAFAQFPHISSDMAEYTGKNWTVADVHNLYLFDAAALAAKSEQGVMITDDYPHTEFPLFNDRRLTQFMEQKLKAGERYRATKRSESQ